MCNEELLDQLVVAGDTAIDVIDALREAYALASAIQENVVAKRAISRAMALVDQARDILGDEVVRLGLEG